LASDVVHSVTTHLNPPARFLQKVILSAVNDDDADDNDGLDKIIGWIEIIGKEKAIHKACQVCIVVLPYIYTHHTFLILFTSCLT
jgi:hypothetical protein